MDAGEWIRWVAAFILGAFSPVAVEFFRGRIERDQRRQDRSNDFQKETLVELQDQLTKLALAAGAIWTEDDWSYQQTGRRVAETEARRELAREDRQATFRIHALRERVQDDRVREAVKRLQDVTAGIVYAPGSRDDPLGSLNEAFTQSQAVIGERLRAL